MMTGSGVLGTEDDREVVIEFVKAQVVDIEDDKEAAIGFYRS